MPISVNVGGTFKQVKSFHVNVGGTFKQVKGGWVNEAGVWKRFLTSSISLSYVTKASSTSQNIIIPSSAQAGDLAVLFDIGRSGSIPALVIPSGFTGIDGTGGGNSSVGRFKASYRLLQSGDNGDAKTGINASVMNKIMLIFRPSAPISSITAPDWESTLTIGDPSPIAVVASGSDPTVLVLGGAYAEGNTGAFNGSTTPAFDDQQSSTNGDWRIGYKVYTGSPVDHTVDMNDISLNALTGGILVIQ